MPAKYNLIKVKSFAQSALGDPTTPVIFFSAPNSSFNCVVKEFSSTATPKDPLEAKIFILETILELEMKDFYKVQTQWETDVADWYGIVKCGIPWLIKFLIGKDEITGVEFLEQISFHRAKWNMHLENRKTITINGRIV